MKKAKVLIAFWAVACMLFACGRSVEVVDRPSTDTSINSKDDKRSAGGRKNETVPKTDSWIVDVTSEPQVVTIGDVEYQVPERFQDNVEEDGDWIYYYHGNASIGVGMDSDIFYTNEEAIASMDAYVAGVTDIEGFKELISKGVIDVGGEQAIEVIITETKDEIDYRLSLITFVYNSREYVFGWYLLDEVSDEYAKDYAALRDSIVLKEVQEDSDSNVQVPAEQESTQKAEDGLIYEDENVTIKYTGVSNDGYSLYINLLVENKSDETITIYNTETSINDFMVDGYCYMEISPGKKINDEISIWDDDFNTLAVEDIENIESKFFVMIDDDWQASYETESVVIFDNN